MNWKGWGKNNGVIWGSPCIYLEGLRKTVEAPDMMVGLGA
jgi:hypothetical protein